MDSGFPHEVALLLIGAAVSAVSALFGAVVQHWLAARREQQRFEQEALAAERARLLAPGDPEALRRSSARLRQVTRFTGLMLAIFWLPALFTLNASRVREQEYLQLQDRLEALDQESQQLTVDLAILREQLLSLPQVSSLPPLPQPPPRPPDPANHVAMQKWQVAMQDYETQLANYLAVQSIYVQMLSDYDFQASAGSELAVAAQTRLPELEHERIAIEMAMLATGSVVSWPLTLFLSLLIGLTAGALCLMLVETRRLKMELATVVLPNNLLSTT